MSENLTELEFWENYWSNIKLPSVVNKEHSFERCLSKELELILSGTSGTIFEVGCAPGKWIGHLSQVLNLVPSGIEYSSLGNRATLENFRILDISPGELLVGDFFELVPKPIHDIVMSLGFIEHFDNPMEVIERHLEWLKPGGILILGVPNFTGIYRWIQSHLDQTLLDKHNLSIMNEDFFISIEKELNIESKSFSYVGSFEPDLPIPIVRFGNPIQIMIKIFLYVMRRLRKIRFVDSINGRYLSGYILSSYRKPA